MTKKILVYLTQPHVEAWNFKSEHKERLQAKVQHLEVDVCSNRRDFLERLPQAEAVVVWYFKRDWLAGARQLKLIATPAAGDDWIEADPTGRLEIWFGGFHGPMIAESVAGAIFYFCKAFEFSSRMQKRRKWARIKVSQRIRSLYGARVTLLGFGRIGSFIGRVIKPFGCRITGVKRTSVEPPDYFSPEDRIATSENLPEVLRETDHLIMVLPGGKATEHMFTRDHFRMLPPSCILYNVGRGNVYRESDLVEALRAGEIAGAYLDVFESEPLAETSPLWEMDNVLIQPHLSAASPQYLELFVDELAARLNSV